MKKILKYSLLFVMGIVMVAGTGCTPKELNTNQFEGFTVAAIAPNPVMRGAELHIVGNGLEDAVEVKFAGDVTVTDIKTIVTGTPCEISVTVPVEGPEVGKVIVVGKDGKSASTKFDLTFTEPISVESFTPATALSGDVITIKGEYLNVVKSIIFAGDVMVNEFESQSRHELQVKVPANALSGAVIVSDVDEINDDSTIPNRIYAPTELKMGSPKVNAAQKAVYKSGQLVKVTGNHLDMIKEVNLPNADGVEFTINEAATELTFVFPAKAKDGAITLVSFENNEFSAGEFEAVVVTDLTVTSLAEDGRFKANNEVKISGTDLDLVTKVEFGGGEESSFYFSDGAIFTHIPAAAKDGAVTVTMESGEQAYSEDLEVVKPIITSWTEVTEALVAGAGELAIEGTDLDLVTSAKIGNKTQSFVDCAFSFDVSNEGVYTVVVEIPRNAYSGPITLASAAGYETATDAIPVTYDEAVTINFDEPSYGLGRNISINGKNLLQVEQIFIKGKKVTNYVVRSDDAMSFAIPDKIGPGVYRLDLVLIDGTELTWPVAFEITAPFTETVIWEGNHDLADWGANLEAGPEDGFVTAGLQEGDLVRIYYNTYSPEWQFKIQDGHWAAINLPILDGANTVNGNYAESGSAYFSFEVNADILAQLTLTGQGWGYSFVINGAGANITGISMIHFGAAEKRTNIWEGSTTVGDWDGSMGALSWGGYDWSTVQAGTKLAVSFTTSSDNAVMRFGNGSWVSIPSLAPLAKEGNLPIAGLTSYEFELTQADVDELAANGGLVICGAFWTITEVALVTMDSGAAAEKTIWEGSSTVTWNGGAVSALAYGGFDWSTVEAGTILCAHYTIDDPEGGCIRFGAGNWASIPSLAPLATDGNLPVQEGGHEIELTQADIDYLIAGDGMVICGTGYTITSVGLK